MILVGAGRERLARFAADPHPGLAGAVAGDEDDEMLEAGFGEFAVELEPRGVVGQAASGRFAEPGGEPALLGNRGEGVVGFSGAQGELFAARFPAEFLNDELGQVAALQEWAGAGEVEWHRSVSADSEGTNNPWFAGLDIVLGHAQAVFLVE